MKTQNFKFGEAVKHLANLAGMQPTFFQNKMKKEKKSGKYTHLFF